MASVFLEKIFAARAGIWKSRFLPTITATYCIFTNATASVQRRPPESRRKSPPAANLPAGDPRANSAPLPSSSRGKANYRNAGTVEFLFTTSIRRKWFFSSRSTRAFKSKPYRHRK